MVTAGHTVIHRVGFISILPFPDVSLLEILLYTESEKIYTDHWTTHSWSTSLQIAIRVWLPCRDIAKLLLRVELLWLAVRKCLRVWLLQFLWVLLEASL